MGIVNDHEGNSTWEDVDFYGALSGSQGAYTMTMDKDGKFWYTNSDGQLIRFNEYNEQIALDDVFNAYVNTIQQAEARANWERSRNGDTTWQNEGRSSGFGGIFNGLLGNLANDGGNSAAAAISTAQAQYDAKDPEFISELWSQTNLSQRPSDTPQSRTPKAGSMAPAAAAPIATPKPVKETRRESADTTPYKKDTKKKYKTKLENMSGLNEKSYSKTGLNTTGM